MTAYDKAVLAAKAINSKKGIDIKIIEIGDITVLADYMIVATGTSSTHVKALSEEVEYRLDEAGVPVNRIEGRRSDSWILLDYADVVVHIFSEESREFYDLERLWQDGKALDISDILE